MARKIRDLRRKSRTRSPKRKITILCEGRNTEPDYFRAIRKLFQGALIDVQVVPGVGVPATIAEKAIEAARDSGLLKGQRKKRDSYERQDQVWAVFDRDDHPKFEESIDRCTSNSIGVAYSVPCFEAWLILHYEDLDRPDDRHDVQKQLAELCDDYAEIRERPPTLTRSSSIDFPLRSSGRRLNWQDGSRKGRGTVRHPRRYKTLHKPFEKPRGLNQRVGLNASTTPRRAGSAPAPRRHETAHNPAR